MWLHGLSSFWFSFTKTQGAGRGTVVKALYVMYVFWAYLCSFARSYRFFSEYSNPSPSSPQQRTFLNTEVIFVLPHASCSKAMLTAMPSIWKRSSVFMLLKHFFTRKGLDFALFSKREFVELGNGQYCNLVRNMKEEPLHGCPSTSIMSYSYSFCVKTLT